MNYPNPNPALAKKLNIFAYIISVAVLGLVFGMRMIKLDVDVDFSFLPRINAIVNTIAGIFLILAIYFIKKKNYIAHRNMIFVATFFSTVFLLTYVLYHITTPETSFCKEGPIRIVYFILLITHIISAALIFPFILFTFIRGITFQVDRHRKMARWVFPVWLYVVITGPICYLLLSPCY